MKTIGRIRRILRFNPENSARANLKEIKFEDFLWAIDIMIEGPRWGEYIILNNKKFRRR